MTVARSQLDRSRLRQLIARAERPQGNGASGAAVRERCELCAAPIPARHRHVLDIAARELLCACRPCALLFDREAAGGDRYRLVPERCTLLADVRLDDLAWRALGVPVELAFFVRDGHSGRVSAYYPSVGGATQSLLELGTWSQIEHDNPVLATLAHDVEALLVNRVGSRREHFVVGIDDCFRLVATVRTHWRGFAGGGAVWTEIARFFDALGARAERP
jgi:hypothetical protein